MVGAGILILPHAMSQLGWGPGVGVLVMSWIITLYTLWQMVEMHEMVPGKRFDRYHELGQHAFGEKLGLYIVIPLQLIVEVGVGIVYMVTGGSSLQRFHQLVCEHCKEIKLTYFIMIFASVQFVLSHLPNFDSISGVSLAAAIMSLSYSTIAWGASLKRGVKSDVQYGYKSKTTAGTVFNFFNSLGSIAFAYAGHNVVLEIQATMPSTPKKPSKGPMWKGVIAAYVAVAICYFPVALIGYWIFGNEVDENIFKSLEKPVWLIAMANLSVVVHLIGSYQIYTMPVFDMIEYLLVKILKFKPSWMLRSVSRNIYVAFTMFIGITLPFFGGLLGFFGGFAFASTTYDYQHQEDSEVESNSNLSSFSNQSKELCRFKSINSLTKEGELIKEIVDQTNDPQLKNKFSTLLPSKSTTSKRFNIGLSSSDSSDDDYTLHQNSQFEEEEELIKIVSGKD
ncbi:lysine histidine transporter 1-like [Olea europaea var. sylvestris]|uniref:lysine histidine transporter 1-like n=1 Tax=Olea europaea var. sylvestris TaxID=158386 RepID=UPI000C1D145B|nr:lysine histidine transporter 1-like [Olea europaea var. sylvestris]